MEFALSLICSSLPAGYRLAVLRQELSAMDDATADDFGDRVLGSLDHDDPLVVALMTAR